MTAIDDTTTLLAIDWADAPATSDQDRLVEQVSRVFVTGLQLQLKARAYDDRLTRAIITAANAGVPLNVIGDAAGMSNTELLRRLTTQPDTLSEQLRTLVAPSREPKPHWWRRRTHRPTRQEVKVAR